MKHRALQNHKPGKGYGLRRGGDLFGDKITTSNPVLTRTNEARVVSSVRPEAVSARGCWQTPGDKEPGSPVPGRARGRR